MMQKISAVVGGHFQSIPVLTTKHLSVIHNIQSGRRTLLGCSPDILQDLIDAGLVVAPTEGSGKHGSSPMA